MCMAAQRPLIESGTNGYNGNVTPIIRGQTPCYECTPKVEGKTYPICTIRSTPSKIVHCVVWAKALYELLFGPYDEFNYLHDMRKSMESVNITEKSASDKWFEKLFEKDVIELEKMTPPEKLKTMPKMKPLIKTLAEINEFYTKFTQSFAKLAAVGSPVGFDKDNENAMIFVYAASNLRAINFGILAETEFKIKEIAGNIIAAISSTNAAVAAMQVIEAVKFLLQNKEKGKIPQNIRNVFVSNVRTNLVNSANAIEPPNPKCLVCGKERKIVKIEADLAKLTLGTFIEKFVKKELGMTEPSAECKGGLLYEAGEGLEEDELERYKERLLKTMKDNGVGEKDVMTFEDYLQNFRVQIEFVDTKVDPEKFPFYFVDKKQEALEEFKEKSMDVIKEQENVMSKAEMKRSVFYILFGLRYHV